MHYGDRDHQCRIHTSALVMCLDMVFKEAKSLLPSPSWTLVVLSSWLDIVPFFLPTFPFGGWVFSSFIKSGKVSSKIVVLKTSNWGKCPKKTTHIGSKVSFGISPLSQLKINKNWFGPIQRIYFILFFILKKSMVQIYHIFKAIFLIKSSNFYNR